MEELERFVPGLEGQIWYEHWHRYHFAVPFAAGKSVADVACGEGYGSALLARHAAHVAGIDASAQTVAGARRRYAGPENLEYLQGRCEALPLGDASVDLVVSFETLEHVQEPRAFIAEAARVLRPDGAFMVSTPDKKLYSDEKRYHNPHHPSELYADEFVAALRERFGAVTLFGQRVDVYSAIWPVEGGAPVAQLLQARADRGADAAAGIPDPMYLIAVCAADAAVLPRMAPPFSLLADQDHRVWKGCENVEQLLAEARIHADRVERAYIEAQKRLAALLQERDRRVAPAAAPAAPEWPPR